MFRSLPWGRFVPFALLAVLACCSATAFAASSVTIGVVDYQTIYEKYAAVKPATQSLQNTYKSLTEPLDALREGIGLKTDDLKTFQDLHRLGTENRTKEQSTQFDALSHKAKENYSTYQVLTDRKKADKLTDDEKARLTELATDIDPVAASYEKQAQEMQDAITAEKQRLQKVLSDQIGETVAKVAKTQKLTLVLNKDIAAAQGETEKIVVWSDDSLDITDKVLTLLNDDYKLHPTIFDKPATK